MDSGIEKWQHSVSSDVPIGSSSSRHDGIASRLATAATDFFGLLLEHARPHTSSDLLRALEREYGYLQLWCDGYSVLSGELDAVLAESRRLRLATYRLLVSVCRTLADRRSDETHFHWSSPLTSTCAEGIAVALPPSLDASSQHNLKAKAAVLGDLATEISVSATYGAEDSDLGSDSGSDPGSDFWAGVGDDAVHDIIEDLSTDIQCLVDLGSRFKEPIRDRPSKEVAALPTQVSEWDPSKSMAARIRHRYPDGDHAFIEIQGQVNWERRQRLYASKESSARDPQRSIQTAGTLVASEFHDSGLGTSVATPSSYAETVLSYHGTKGGSIKIPPVPAEGLEGKPFACDICGRRCQLPASNWKSFWKYEPLPPSQTSCPFPAPISPEC